MTLINLKLHLIRDERFSYLTVNGGAWGFYVIITQTLLFRLEEEHFHRPPFRILEHEHLGSLLEVRVQPNVKDLTQRQQTQGSVRLGGSSECNASQLDGVLRMEKQLERAPCACWQELVNR